MILMIDNYDSFTYNLVQYLGELGADVQVYRNDQITIAQIREVSPQGIIISPGPCTPDQAGISLDVIQTFAGKIPLFGVCLGHQSIGQVFGGEVIRAKTVMHGKISQIYHNKKGIFAGLPSPFKATRYHSLVVAKATFPECLEITAWTENEQGEFDEIMALRHRDCLIEGVQFHPESILTEYGKQLLNNFLSNCQTYRAQHAS
jgi:anthranilate synthase component II